jgi:hypothetical protein
MEEFIANMALASISLLIGGAVFLAILNWLADEFTAIGRMNTGDWIGIAIFFGVAAMIASTM